MAITLRLVKGSELTHQELDDNFTTLSDVALPATPGTWNPAAIDLSAAASYEPYTLPGNVTLALTGTPVVGGYNILNVTGDGTRTMQPSGDVVWSQGTPQDARVVPSGDQMLTVMYVGDWAGAGVPKAVAMLQAVGGGGGDAAPTQDTSDATPYALSDASRLHLNVQVRSHQASVDFEVPQAAGAGSAWWVFFDHNGCTISNNGGVGSVNGVSDGFVRGVNGGWAVVSIKSNASSAPVVEVKGDIVVPTVQVDSTKTLDADDSGQDFVLMPGAGTQTLPAIANLPDGWYVNYGNISGGAISFDATTNGGDANHSLPNGGVVAIKKWGPSLLLAFGSNGLTSLDAF